MRTWCRSASHVEIYCGCRTSWASRNGLGVNQYAYRRNGLSHILRPTIPFDAIKAHKFFETVKGTPYGWLDLFRFFSLNLQSKGLICSQFGDLLLGAGSVIAFSRDYAAGAVSPRDFLVSPALKRIWKST
jgi:hypothetical protein